MRPRLRGVLHQYAFVVALVAGAALVLEARTPRAQLAAGLYVLALAGLFATSALYHRVTWAPDARPRIRRLDHAMIFVLIAGTYTPFALLVLRDGLANAVLAVAWGGAALGVLLNLGRHPPPKWAMAAICVALGWVGLVAAPAVVSAAGPLPIALLVAGGVLYTLGAAVYALRRPDPVPSVFGYHEVFHALVIVAAAAHYAAVALYALPRG